MASISSVSLKLWIDPQISRVVYAEANKDFVDFLFHILSLPVTTLVSLLKKQGLVGSLANLHGSIQTLQDCYFQSTLGKYAILNPGLPPACSTSVPLLLCNKAAPIERAFYRCERCERCVYVTDEQGVKCPKCWTIMTKTMRYVAPPVKYPGPNEVGYVKGAVAYMVMDDLVVEPLSTESIISLLKKFEVKNVGALEEKMVTLRREEAIGLVKASLMSDKVLTEVFCKNG